MVRSMNLWNIRQTNLEKIEEAKIMYSGKHHIYCIKSEVVHAPKSGVAMRISSGHPGSQHDLDIYQANVGDWIAQLLKTPTEKQQFPNGTYHHHIPLAQDDTVRG